MWEKIRVVFTIPELWQKIRLTLILLAVYRVGYLITLPTVDNAKLESFFRTDAGGFGELFAAVAQFSAARLNSATIFGLGIMPYISASIILQVLGLVYPPLEQLQKEGESGRKKINEWTRYLTVFLCIMQSWAFVSWLAQSGVINPRFMVNGVLPFWWHLYSVLTMTTGTMFLMWLGEQIDEYGIGNGISLLIMAGILAELPAALLKLYQTSRLELGQADGKQGVEIIVVLILMFVAVIMGVVFITMGQRQIPMQSAKHMRGRRQAGGTRDYLPLKVNMANVMPIVFASSMLLIPGFLLGMLRNVTDPSTWWGSVIEFLHSSFERGSSFGYNALFVVLIFVFCFFWTAIIFNPKDVADNLKNFGSFIPGRRPGKWTADYLEKVVTRITYVGAAFLALVAVLPTIVTSTLGVDAAVASFFGGTGLLIAVSVTFDLVQKIDSHLVMRNYKGILEK